MSDQDLCWMTGTQAAALFRAGKLSPVELLQAVLARAESVEGVVNAFASTYFDRAMEQARAAEARFARKDGDVRPLEGLSLVLKTNTDSSLEGTNSSNGSLWRTGIADDHTSPTVQRLVDAGAIVHARTTMPELGWCWTCSTRAHGVTRNPWNPLYSAGGSSSGSAAAVAAGTTTLGCATDALGSLRHPSAMCGVLGFKPPYGRNPLHPTVSFDFFKHIGPMTRTVADSVLMQNVMSGPHPLDHTSVNEIVSIPAELPDIRGLRIAYSVDFGHFPVTDDVRRETLTAIAALKDAGADVEEVPMGWAVAVMAAASRYTDRMYADAFEAALRDHPDEVCDYTQYFADEGGSVSGEEFHQALIEAGWAWQRHFGPIFAEYDAFVCPTLAFHHVPAESRPWEENIVVRGKSYTDHDGVMTGLFNIYSRCPVLAAPSGFTDEGMPTSLQIAGRPFDDITVYRIAAALERVGPWLDAPQRRPAIPAVARR